MNHSCKKCNSKLLHYEIHDGYCCLLCNTWRGEGCNNPYGCTYCDNRPKTPFSIEDHNAILSSIIRDGFELSYQKWDDLINN